MDLAIGIFGGTFDPIHNGHIELAGAVLKKLNLEKIYFVVANDPWQKSENFSVTDPLVRLEMVEGAIEKYPKFEASNIEIVRGGPSYTIETVREFKELFPGYIIYLLLGSDAAKDILTWEKVEGLKREVKLAVVTRKNYESYDDFFGFDYIQVVADTPDISSTLVREKILSGQSIEKDVPESTMRAITKYTLYH